MWTTTFATLRWTKTSPGREADDLVGGNAAVGAADPEVLGRLPPDELREDCGSPRDHRRGPGAVVLEELGEVGHGDRLSRRSTHSLSHPGSTQAQHPSDERIRVTEVEDRALFDPEEGREPAAERQRPPLQYASDDRASASSMIQRRPSRGTVSTTGFPETSPYAISARSIRFSAVTKVLKFCPIRGLTSSILYVRSLASSQPDVDEAPVVHGFQERCLQLLEIGVRPALAE